MTIQEIKDYMDKVFEDYLNNKIGQYTFIGKICKVRYMLDQVDNDLVDKETFEKKYCKNCGSQRCEGVNSKWFNGCEDKKE